MFSIDNIVLLLNSYTSQQGLHVSLAYEYEVE